MIIALEGLNQNKLGLVRDWIREIINEEYEVIEMDLNKDLESEVIRISRLLEDKKKSYLIINYLFTYLVLSSNKDYSRFIQKRDMIIEMIGSKDIIYPDIIFYIEDKKDEETYRDYFLELVNYFPSFKYIPFTDEEEVKKLLEKYLNGLEIENNFLLRFINLVFADTLPRVNIIIYGEEGCGKTLLVNELTKLIANVGKELGYKPLITTWQKIVKLPKDIPYDLIVFTFDDATYTMLTKTEKNLYFRIRHIFTNAKKVISFFITHRFWDLDKAFRSNFQFLILKSSPANPWDRQYFKKLLGDYYWNTLLSIDEARYSNDYEAFNYFIVMDKFGEIYLGRYEPFILGLRGSKNGIRR